VLIKKNFHLERYREATEAAENAALTTAVELPEEGKLETEEMSLKMMNDEL
jgi:hypothetical protein